MYPQHLTVGYWLAYDVLEFLGGSKDTSAGLLNTLDPTWPCSWSIVNNKARLITASWQPHTVFVSEADSYSLIARIEKPEAAKFIKWIIEKVLPALRQTEPFTTVVADIKRSRCNCPNTVRSIDAAEIELTLLRGISKNAD